jgi:hypothetical protein
MYLDFDKSQTTFLWRREYILLTRQQTRTLVITHFETSICTTRKILIYVTMILCFTRNFSITSPLFKTFEMHNKIQVQRASSTNTCVTSYLSILSWDVTLHIYARNRQKLAATSLARLSYLLSLHCCCCCCSHIPSDFSFSHGNC